MHDFTSPQEYCLIPYFAGIARQHGIPHISTEAFLIYMNIIAIESKLMVIEDIKTNLPLIENRGYAKLEFKLKDQLEKLTRRREPKQVLEELFLLG